MDGISGAVGKGGVRAFEFEGLGLKVCELWNSPPPFQGHVCLILGSVREQWIFVMDLGRGDASSSGSGFSGFSSDGGLSSGSSRGFGFGGGSSSGGGSPWLDGSSSGGVRTLLVDRSGVNPINMCPNLRIPRGFVDSSGDVHCCVWQSTLYIFKIRENQNGLWVDVYSISLRQVIKCSDVILDDEMLKYHPVLMSLSFKKDPVPLPLSFLDGILLFSTQIYFFGHHDHEIEMNESFDFEMKESFDFELYDPITNECTILPPLLIRPLTNTQYCETFQLFHPDSYSQSSSWEEFPIFVTSSLILPFFSIHSYALHNTEFLIQTSFGRMFSIDLRSPDEWRLLDQGLNFSEYEDRGLKFMGRGRNFISSDGRVCVDAYGVTRFRDKCVGSPVDERVNRVDFPLPFVPGVCRSLVLLDEHTPCFIQVGPDALHSKSYEVLRNPKWCMDLFKADFANLLADGCNYENDEKNEDDEKKEHMERIASFKFCVKNQRVPNTYFLGLFPCRV